MRTTIDKAGRVVIPAPVRERAGLSAGSELEVTEDELGIRLEPVAADNRPAIDVAALVNNERNHWR